MDMRMHYLTKNIQQENFKKAYVPETREEKIKFFTQRIADLEEKINATANPMNIMINTLNLNKRLLEGLSKNGKA
jgi:hypothetical protein